MRIEDTDLERSTPESVQAILDGMAWLGLDYDEGPFYQMQRMARYKEVIAQLVGAGKAYRCYASKEELDVLREKQRARGEKPRYDGRWRDSTQSPPLGVAPVIRFKNPLGGEVVINDLIKGPIVVSNSELDDLIIARSDGTPTYNFCVVVDDWDMGITHVIRGDDHVNNTPRQMNILAALGAELPHYAHVPMILGADGQRLSKRHGAVSVMQYAAEGFLPGALLNYLARLGWAHGDAEIFSLPQFVEWFELAAVNRAAAQFDGDKLVWVNQQYLKQAPLDALAEDLARRLAAKGLSPALGPPIAAAAELFRDRSNTLAALAEHAAMLYDEPVLTADQRSQQVTAQIRPALQTAHQRLADVAWEREAIGALLKSIVSQHQLKLPQLMMPLRQLITGRSTTPSLDAVLALLPRERVLARLAAALAS